VRKLCDEHDAVFIMDDIRSTLRIDIRGTWEQFGVHPDLCCQCKGIANGQPLAAIIGVEKLRAAAAKVSVPPPPPQLLPLPPPLLLLPQLLPLPPPLLPPLPLQLQQLQLQLQLLLLPLPWPPLPPPLLTGRAVTHLVRSPPPARSGRPPCRSRRPSPRLTSSSTVASSRCAAVSAQNLGQLQPSLAVLPQERTGRLASSGPT
jgi:hypothetical protein